MKVTNIRRKLIAALVTAGMMSPAAAWAANFNQNLVINGDFENVDLGVTQAGAVKILDWTAGNQNGYAYSHDGFMGVPGSNYANGGPLAAGGHFYFTPNATPGDIHVAGQVTQLIDVSTGASGAAIAAGTARLRVGAYFTGYAMDHDYGSVYAEFLNSSNAQIGALQVDDTDTTTWNQFFSTAAIPNATKTVRLSIFGTRVTGGGPDGYIDNVDVQVVPAGLTLIVDRATGNLTIKNTTGDIENISEYSITSAFEALGPPNWKSITDNYDAGNLGPNQVDPDHNWTKITDPGTHLEFHEADLESGIGASLADSKTIAIGGAGAWIQNPTEDLVFQYFSAGQQKQGIVSYTGNNGLPYLEGDLNVDGVINSADWGILRSNQLADLSSKSLAEAYRLGDLTGDKLNDHADFVEFKALYDAANGAGAFLAMSAAVPEPTTAFLVLTAGTLLWTTGRRRGNR